MVKAKKRRATKQARRSAKQAKLDQLPKISETIIEFSKPLLDLTPADPPTIEDLRTVMVLATVAWNLPIMATGDSEEAERLRRVSEECIAQTDPAFRQLLDELMRVRLTKYGHDPRQAIVEVVDEGGGEARIAATATLPKQPR